jgi:hypothetical protein
MSCVSWSQRPDSFNRLSNPTAFLDSGVEGAPFSCRPVHSYVGITGLVKAINLEPSFFLCNGSRPKASRQLLISLVSLFHEDVLKNESARMADAVYLLFQMALI